MATSGPSAAGGRRATAFPLHLLWQVPPSIICLHVEVVSTRLWDWASECAKLLKIKLTPPSALFPLVVFFIVSRVSKCWETVIYHWEKWTAASHLIQNSMKIESKLLVRVFTKLRPKKLRQTSAHFRCSWSLLCGQCFVTAWALCFLTPIWACLEQLLSLGERGRTAFLRAA